MKRVILILAITIYAFSWQYYADLGGGLDESRDVDQCADGGFFITGRSNGWAHEGYYNNWYDHEMFLVKLNPNGEREWVRHYGQTGWFIYGSDTIGYYDAGWSVAATADSGAIIVGKTQSPKWTDPMLAGHPDCPGQDNVFIVRVDKYGDTLWTKGYGGDEFDRAWCVKTIPESSDFFLVGPTSSYGLDAPAGDINNLWIMRIDSEGEIIHESFWCDSTRGGYADVRWCVVTPDGGLAMAGATDMHDTTYMEDGEEITRRISDVIVVRTDAECNILWATQFGRGYDSYSRGICNAWDGGFYVATKDRYPARTWIIKLNDEGDTLWSRYVGVHDIDTSMVLANYNMIIQGHDDGYILSGGGGGFAQLAKFDSDMDDNLWNAYYEYGDRGETFLSCCATSDGGACGAGYTYSVAPSAYSDIFVGRCNGVGADFEGVSEKTPPKPDYVDIIASPNPFNSIVDIKIDINKYQDYAVQIFSNDGRIIKDYNFARDGRISWIPNPELPSGLYTIRAVSENFDISESILFIK
ncbi:MAG: T9SS type A sorting domain-containing protein [Candidatus Zixiibacteriota bacterium]